MIFVGDIMCHRPQIIAARAKEEYNFATGFQYLKPLFDSIDLVFGNLETTLPGKPPYTGYPRFRSPDALARDLKKTGFDVLLTSNNHSNDADGKGLINTINTLQKFGFYQTGTFRNSYERELYYPLIIKRNGFTITILNYTYDTNGVPSEHPTVVNITEEEQIILDINKAKTINPDIVLVVMHWGDEYKSKENKKQRALAKMMLEAGADLIVGSHPHVVQPILGVNDGQKSKLVSYSLGNFISNQQKKHTDGGIMLEVRFTKEHNRVAEISESKYIPIWRYISQEKGRKVFSVLPISQFEDNPEFFKDGNALERMKSYGKHVRDILKDSESEEKVF